MRTGILNEARAAEEIEAAFRNLGCDGVVIAAAAVVTVERSRSCVIDRHRGKDSHFVAVILLEIYGKTVDIGFAIFSYSDHSIAGLCAACNGCSGSGRIGNDSVSRVAVGNTINRECGKSEFLSSLFSLKVREI